MRRIFLLLTVKMQIPISLRLTFLGRKMFVTQVLKEDKIVTGRGNTFQPSREEENIGEIEFKLN